VVGSRARLAQIAVATRVRLRARGVLLLVVLCLVIGVSLPQESLAKGWVVRGASGGTMGRVVKVSSKRCVVYDASGERCGVVQWRGSTYSYLALMFYAGDTGVRKEAELDGNEGSVAPPADYNYYIDNSDGGGDDGFSLRYHHRWEVLKWKDNRLMGYVSLKAPGWGAAGAVFILNPKF
jgi:hypothetical protein